MGRPNRHSDGSDLTEGAIVGGRLNETLGHISA